MENRLWNKRRRHLPQLAVRMKLKVINRNYLIMPVKIGILLPIILMKGLELISIRISKMMKLKRYRITKRSQRDCLKCGKQSL
jgi:hypothetical protein